MTEIEKRVLQFVELNQDEVFDSWTPTQRMYNHLENILLDENLADMVEALQSIQNIFNPTIPTKEN